MDRHANLFAACVGTGLQLLVLALCIFLLSLIGWFMPHNRGEVLSAIVVLFCFTSGTAGRS